MKQASSPLSLNDGTRIMSGDPVSELHLWNDHVPQFPSGGPTLGWARRAHALMVHSLSLLADHVATEPEWQGVPAFYADAPISPKRSLASVRALSRRMASSLRFGAGLFGIPFTMLLKACCWAV